MKNINALCLFSLFGTLVGVVNDHLAMATTPAGNYDGPTLSRQMAPVVTTATGNYDGHTLSRQMAPVSTTAAGWVSESASNHRYSTAISTSTVSISNPVVTFAPQRLGVTQAAQINRSPSSIVSANQIRRTLNDIFDRFNSGTHEQRAEAATAGMPFLTDQTISAYDRAGLSARILLHGTPEQRAWAATAGMPLLTDQTISAHGRAALAAGILANGTPEQRIMAITVDTGLLLRTTPNTRSQVVQDILNCGTDEQRQKMKQQINSLPDPEERKLLLNLIESTKEIEELTKLDWSFLDDGIGISSQQTSELFNDNQESNNKFTPEEGNKILNLVCSLFKRK